LLFALPSLLPRESVPTTLDQLVESDLDGEEADDYDRGA
jgi:hypothetical protein